jgi:excisionase family DNA binding protein
MAEGKTRKPSSNFERNSFLYFHVLHDVHTPRQMTEKITSAQAAKILGISPGRVRQLVLAGELASEKFGRDHLFDRTAIDEYQQRRRPIGRPRKAREERKKDLRMR